MHYWRRAVQGTFQLRQACLQYAVLRIGAVWTIRTTTEQSGHCSPGRLAASHAVLAGRTQICHLPLTRVVHAVKLGHVAYAASLRIHHGLSSDDRLDRP